MRVHVCVCVGGFLREIKSKIKIFKVGMALFRRLIIGRGHLLELRGLI